MLLRRLFPFLAAASLLAACSGPQSSAGDAAKIVGWNHSFEAAPADSALLFGYDLGEEEALILRGMTQPEESTSVQAILSMMVDEVFRDFSVSSVEELGIDPAGDLSGFVWRNSAHFVIRATDPGLLARRFSDEAPSRLVQGDIEVLDQSCLMIEESDANIYVCPLDEFVMFSMFPTQAANQGAVLAEILSGSAGGSFMNTPISREAFAATGASGDPLAIVFADVGRLNSLIEAVNDMENSDTVPERDRELLGVEDNSASMEAGSSSESAACQEAAADIASRYRWLGGAIYRDDEHVISETRLSMSSGQAESAREVLVGSPSAASVVFDNAIYGLSLGLDLRRLLDNLPTDRHLDACENIALIRGYMSQMDPEDMHEMRRALALVSGSMTMGIFNIDLQGMVPLVDGAIAIKTGQPERLAAQIEGELTEDGNVSVRVIPDAAHPTSEFSSPALPMTVRMIQGTDRVVLSTGNPPAAAIEAMLVPGETSEILRVHVNGDRASAFMGDVQQYLTDMGAGDPYAMGAGTMVEIIKAIGALNTTDGRIEFSGNDLVFRSVQERTAPVAE